MKKSVRSVTLLFFLLLYLTFFSGCQHGRDLASANLPHDVPGISDRLNPDAYMEVDCLLPGQVRKLGSMIYNSPRRPLRTTANDCEIRGGEYVVYDRANYKESLAVWMVSAESGDPVAQTYVGEIYMKSPAEKPRYDLAAQWFERAAKSGHKRAQVNLGYLYENGLGVAANMDQAAIWYSKASNTDIKEIVQQLQLSARERAELAELKIQSAAQATELRRLKNERQVSQDSLVLVREELEKRNGSIKAQQQEISRKYEELKEIEQQLAARKLDTATGLKEQLAVLQSGLKEKEREFFEQKRLATELSGQIKKQQSEEKNFQVTLADLNKKLANLPGPKIEVLNPQLLRTRGIVVAAVGKGKELLAISGTVWSPAGLQYFKVNGRDTEFNADGKFRALVPMDAKEVNVKLLATDHNGKIDEMQFTLQQRDSGDGKTNAPGADSSAQAAASIEFGKYYALVIGNNEYRQLSKLKTAVEDARDVGKLLEEQYGFQVTRLYNADRNAILSTLNDFRKRLTEKDNFLIYYAGHGTIVEKNTQGFWLPVDASLDDDVNWLPTDRVTGIMNLMSAKQIIVIADACYSGMMTRASLTRLESGKSTETYNKWIEKMVGYKSRVIISSGEIKPVLDGGGGIHSVFAKALIDTLHDNTKIMLGIDLHRAVAEKVVNASSRLGLDQVPQYAGLNRAGHELGDFLFVPKQHGI